MCPWQKTIVPDENYECRTCPWEKPLVKMYECPWEHLKGVGRSASIYQSWKLLLQSTIKFVTIQDMRKL